MAERTILPAARHEHRDIGGRFIVFAFLLLITSLAGAALVAWWAYPGATGDTVIPDPLPKYPSPRLQPDPHEDWARFYAAELQYLNSYGWVDQSKGTAHIPIDEAMRRIAHQGIPGWPSQATPSPSSTQAARQ